MRRILCMLALALVVGGTAFAEDMANPPAPEKADNSGRNARERDKAENTPTDQKENAADLDITKKIRQSVMDDKALSTYAHNVKIITQNGVVNLKGPVRTAEEKKSVEDKAAQIAGADKVKSQIEIAPKE